MKKKLIFFLIINIMLSSAYLYAYDPGNDCYGTSMGCNNWSAWMSRVEGFHFLETGSCTIGAKIYYRYCLDNPNVYEFNIDWLTIQQCPPPCDPCIEAENFLFPNGQPDWDNIQLIYERIYLQAVPHQRESNKRYQN